jgi:hypothetical protein
MATIDPFSIEGAKQIAQIAGQQPAPISANALSTPALPTLPQPAPSPIPATPMVPTIDQIYNAPPTDLEKKFTDTAIAEGNTAAALADETAYRTMQEQANDITAKKKTANDLTTSLNNLKAEADQIPLSVQNAFEGRGATEGGVAPLQASETRKNTIKQIGVSAMLNAANGNLATAQDQVDNAVRAKFDPLKAQLAAKQAQLQALMPLYNAEQTKAAEKRAALYDQEKRALDKQEAEQKNINSVMLTAASYNADAKTLTKIQNATTYAEAISAAGKYIQDPKAKYDLEAARLDNVLKQLQANKLVKETAQIGQPTATERKAAEEAAATAKNTIPILQDKIKLIDSIINSPGLKANVGSTALGRVPFTSEFTGAGQAFRASVQQLTNEETLDQLLSLKKKGGTLGALSDSEGALLRNAATKINSWEIKSGPGAGRYNIDEQSFINEVNTIKTLTERALTAAGDNLLSSDEKSALDTFFATPALAPTGSFDPAAYYSTQ